MPWEASTNQMAEPPTPTKASSTRGTTSSSTPEPVRGSVPGTGSCYHTVNQVGVITTTLDFFCGKKIYIVVDRF